MAETAVATSCETGERSEVYRRRHPERTVLLRALRRTLHDCSPGAGPEARFGAVSFLHRFGASLNPHFHYHLCVLDGVHEAVDEEEGESSRSRSVRFHEATALTRADVEALQETVRRRILRWFGRQGLLEEHTVREMLGWDHAGGFSLDASVRIAAHDRAGLERLLRYCARPPFALDRIEWRDAGGPTGRVWSSTGCPGRRPTAGH